MGSLRERGLREVVILKTDKWVKMTERRRRNPGGEMPADSFRYGGSVPVSEEDLKEK